MSIAVSAVLRPSRWWRAALVSHAAANLVAGLVLACSPPGAFLLAQWLGACCLLAGWAGARLLASAGKTRRIDISGLGQIRLTVQQTGGAADLQGMLVRLMPGSTVWPQAMFLLLQHEAGGAVTVLAVLPDSVAREQFRALAVAMRALGGVDKLDG